MNTQFDPSETVINGSAKQTTWPTAKFSLFKNPITNISPNKAVSLEEIFELIKGIQYKESTERLRAISDPLENRKFKSNKFDFVTFSGVFTKRNEKGLIKHSQLLVLDFDKVPDVNSLKKALLKDKYFNSELIFTSPSGNGLKWVIKINLEEGSHSQWFAGMVKYVKTTYNIEIDRSGADVARACFLSYDPEVKSSNKTSRIIKREKFILKLWTYSKNEIRNTKTPVQKQEMGAAKGSGFNKEDLNILIQKIEEDNIDITSNYKNWVNIGFGLASEFAEEGREYFHRISQYYPQYSINSCNEQYNNCLRSEGKGITIRTLFQIAKEVGLIIEHERSSASEDFAQYIISDSMSENEENLSSIFNTPTLPNEIYANLPEILLESCKLFQPGIEKDVFLIASIAVLSGCLPNIEGIYFDEPYSPHLYVFITAPAGSGKGKMKWARYFGQAIHDNLNEQWQKEQERYEFMRDTNSYLSCKVKIESSKPIEPKRKMFYIPANSSSSAFIQALSANNFKAVLFETEADTLAETFKQEWGNFSDILRKAFHHESTSMFRRKDNEYTEIKDPHIAIVLSGTPRQVHNMMPDVENGLFSRFLYYAFEDYSDFKNPFVSHGQVNYSDFFTKKATIIYELFKILDQSDLPIQIKLSTQKAEEFTRNFNEILNRNKLLLGNDFSANIKRLGVITFRIAMIFTALRINIEEKLPNPIICSDLDFQNAMSIALTLEKHAIAVFQNLPNNRLKGVKLRFFEKLPQQFDRQGYLKVAEELGLHFKTAEKYISQFVPKLLGHEHNRYTKSQNISN